MLGLVVVFRARAEGRFKAGTKAKVRAMAITRVKVSDGVRFNLAMAKMVRTRIRAEARVMAGVIPVTRILVARISGHSPAFPCRQSPLIILIFITVGVAHQKQWLGQMSCSGNIYMPV